MKSSHVASVSDKLFAMEGTFLCTIGASTLVANDCIYLSVGVRGRCVLFVCSQTERTIVHTLSVPRTGRFVGIKFLRSAADESLNANIDVEYVGFKGFTQVKGFAEGTIR